MNRSFKAQWWLDHVIQKDKTHAQENTECQNYNNKKITNKVAGTCHPRFRDNGHESLE